MKSALTHALFFLFEICVFGDEVKAETVSVIEGDSVTLHTGVTEIQRDDGIEWRLKGNRIARISGDPSRTDGVFRDRLKLDNQTGDITITNIKTTDSGEYTLMITTSTRGSSEKIFSVSAVNRFDGVTVVGVTEGDSVVLHTDTEILRDDEILWRFRGEYDIAQMKKDEYFSINDPIAGGIFRRRLHLDHQTGNLIISDIRFKTSGLYEVDVKKRRTYTIHKAFNVTVTDRLNRLTVKAGVTVILESGVTELLRDDLVRWRFEHEDVLAEINKTAGIFSTYDDVPDGRFRDRLKLDHQTGSLNITHTKTSDSGLYHLDITGNRHTIFRKFDLSVCGSCRSQDDVTLIGPAFGAGAGAGAAVVLGLLLVAAVACVIYYRYRRFKLVTHSVPKSRSEVEVMNDPQV